MESFNDYIEENKEWIKSLSEKTYGKKADCGGSYIYRDTNVYYSFDYEDAISEICFARLYRHMAGKKISSNYWLKLPYEKGDTKEELDSIYLDYSSIFSEMKEMVSGVFNMEIHKTGYKNIKLITFSENMNLIKDIDYSLTLILFCLLRGMDTEYHEIWKTKNKDENLPNTLSKYYYEYSVRTNGNDGHDINDTIADVFSKKNKTSVDFKTLFINRFFNTLKLTFGKDGYVKHKNFKKYFQDMYVNEGKYGSYAMQTSCFDYIERVTNKIYLEERL